MDKELFKQKLSEVADWRIQESTVSATVNAKRKIRKMSEEELYQYEREKMFLEEFGGVNPTMPVMITKLKCQPVECTDCGRQCEQGRKVDIKMYKCNGVKHWREHCLVCDLTKNPYTDKFDLSTAEASIKWNYYFRDQRVNKDQSDDNCMIRKNPEDPMKI
jgi:hypothetical protein